MNKLLASKKITIATVKSFIKRNMDDLYINVKSDFDGMTDCVQPCHGGFQKAKRAQRSLDHNLGVDFAWFVGSSRDYFSLYDDGEFSGIEVYNSCGSFVLAVKK